MHMAPELPVSMFLEVSPVALGRAAVTTEQKCMPSNWEQPQMPGFEVLGVPSGRIIMASV